MVAVRHSIRATRIGGVAAMLMLSQFVPAQAAVLFDQIGPAVTNYRSNQIYALNSFQSLDRRYNLRVIDDFTLAHTVHAMTVTVQVSGYSGPAANNALFLGFENVYGWVVTLWRTEADAIADSAFGPTCTWPCRAPLRRFEYIWAAADVTYIGGMPTTPAAGLPRGTNGPSTLVSMGLGGTGIFLDPGTYWLSVAPVLDLYKGSISIATSGTGNASYVAQSDYYGLPGRTRALGSNAAFRIEGIVQDVPEPATWAMLIAGFGFVGVAMRRRHALGFSKRIRVG